MEIAFVIIGIIIGFVIGWLIAKSKNTTTVHSEKEAAQQRFNAIEMEFASYKASTNGELKASSEKLLDKQNTIDEQQSRIQEKENALSEVRDLHSTSNANLKSIRESLDEKLNDIAVLRKELLEETTEMNETNKLLISAKSDNKALIEKLENYIKSSQQSSDEKTKDIVDLKNKLETKTTEFNEVNKLLASFTANNKALNENLETQKKITQESLDEKINDIRILKNDLIDKTKEFNEANKSLASATANNIALNERLDTQKNEIEELGKKFNLEFENIANKILETKTEKFTELNKTNLKNILDPLGQNIDDFKKVVSEVYNSESKERFSLGEKVKELAELNQQISKEARDLTRALKGEAKTQGRWGEMILESILEKSGLRKDEEYFMEYQLTDEKGNPLLSTSEGKKMRPDAVIKYPDNRNVIIDSKVSLNAFTRYLETTEVEEQKKELADHVTAVKNHIVALSNKGYDDYDKSLDFVMMFIPSEPAYIAAVQGDPQIWNFAYDKRILLLNPTNLITSLKLIVDLWKREKHNRNAQDIADRGAKMYDKFVSFVSNLEDIGKNLTKAQTAYNDSYKQLTTGSDNLVLQATKMKNLGLTPKKNLSDDLILNASSNALND